MKSRWKGKVRVRNDSLEFMLQRELESGEQFLLPQCYCQREHPANTGFSLVLCCEAGVSWEMAKTLPAVVKRPSRDCSDV